MKIKLPHSFFVIAFLLLQALSFQTYAQVTANFSSNPSTGCAPLTVAFTDASTGSPTSWFWNLGNGNNSTLQNPGAVYSIPGTYTITLTASNGGLNSTKTSTITVFGKPTANFKTSAMPSCVGKIITFTDASTSAAGAITKWAWDFGDGTALNTLTGSATHSYASGGTFPVTLIITDINGCTNNIVLSVTVLPSPVASFTGTPLTACKPPLTVNFTNTSTTSGTVSYLWKFGDGTPNSTLTSPSHPYTALGNYKVTLIVTQGACVDSIVKTNYVVVRNIVAKFSANDTTVCAGSTVTFSDLSVPLTTSRIWNFGDGTPTSTAANPSHIYTSPGTYTVSLLNASANGCVDSLIKIAYITVYPLPVAAFTANLTQSCSAPFSVNFTDNSTNASSWVWNFGDGSPTSVARNPTHIYTTPGTFTVSLIVTSANGCVDTIIRPKYILISPPVAGFRALPREGCIPLSVNFVDTSSSLVDPIVSYNWDFGNGTSTTTLPAINRTYPASGVYTVRLIITTAAGCKDTAIYTNYIKAGIAPNANFTVVDSVLCYGEIAMFNQLSTGADSSFWLFGDGSTMPMRLPGTNPVSHFYPDTGLFTVTLVAYNNGCWDSLRQPNIVRILPPKPIFSFQLNCSNPYSVDFTDASQGADSLTWDLGDGSPLVIDSLSFTHVYTTRGPKTVTLTAYNFTTGCSFFVSNSFTIADLIPLFTPGPNIGCYPLSVTFTNNSQDDIDSSLWNYGDGGLDTATSITFSPTHTYALPGLYKAKLFTKDINGCRDTTISDIIVQGALPDFTADTLKGCAPLPIVFTDKSISDSTLVQWKWSFGDLISQTTTSPAINHTYTAAGSYTVKMVVTDKNGCSDSITKISYIRPTFPVPRFVTISDTFACRNEVLTFNASTSNVALPATYTWRFGDGTGAVGLTTNTTTHAYTSDNTYTVTLIITDMNGCIDSIKHKIFVQHPNADFKDSVGTEACAFKDMYFFDKSTGVGITSWKWDFGDGATSLTKNPKHAYTIPGLYTVSLIVTNSAGCTDTVRYPNLVVVPGPIGTFTFAPTTGCNPLTVIFTATSTNTTEYIWDFGDGTPPLTTTSATVQHIYNKTSTPILLLGNTLSNGSPCRLPTPTAGPVTITQKVIVDIDSSIVKLKEGEHFIIDSKITGAGPNPTYFWTPPYNLNCTDCIIPSVLGNGSGDIFTYYFTVTDQGGCIGTDSIKFIFTICEDDLMIPNVFTPNDDGKNDAFDVEGPCVNDNYEIQIYDRWGILLFYSKVRNYSWDGRTKSGQPAPDGVYYYILTLKEKPYRGFLQLIR